MALLRGLFDTADNIRELFQRPSNARWLDFKNAEGMNSLRDTGNAAVFSFAAYHYSKTNAPEVPPNARIMLAIADLFASHMSRGNYSDARLGAHHINLTLADFFVNINIELPRISARTRAEYDAQVLVNKTWPVGGTAPTQATLPQAIEAILWCLASPSATMINLRTLILCTYMVALSTRGQLSNERDVLKVKTVLSTSLNIPIELTMESISFTWSEVCNGYMTQADNVRLFSLWQGWLAKRGDSPLRIRLAVEQILWRGLTQFATCVRALQEFPNFRWQWITALFPTEWSAFCAAVEAVAQDSSYGFRSDLGPARGTLYRPITYVAKELLIKVNGEQMLGQYAHLSRALPHKVAIDEAIMAYQATYDHNDNMQNEEGDCFWGSFNLDGIPSLSQRRN